MVLDPKALSLAPILLFWVAAAGSQDVEESLHDRARAGQVEAVRDLLAEAGPGLDAADASGWTALMYAVQDGHDEVVQVLLEAGADPDRQNPSGETALHLAARSGRTASARLLLQAGADFGLQDSEGRTPLYRAVEGRHADIIEMLQAAALAKGMGVLSLAALEAPEKTLPPRILESTPAPYPESARARGVEGRVVLMVLVRRDGSVGDASVSRGLDPSLDEIALRTVKEWKFVPALRNGKTVEVVLQVEVEFGPPAEP
ncbi:MAG: TonB family protein [Acidobacteria bacterium]|jgi:TonB family protein|nr:TonB family protein [Acidobacteriota bacterium]